MYEKTFGLRERPFGVTPDPRAFYENGIYAEAEAVLRYGIRERKGFVLLTGEAGTGKTTLLRRLMESLSDTAFVFVFNTSLSFDDMLAFACDELALTPKDGGRLARIQALNEFLLRQIHARKTTALLIDEAQNLKDETLEELRLLSNLETSGEKLLQIVLTGQPELEARLAAPHLRQLAQRIAVRCRLERLGGREVGDYVRERLRLAGTSKDDLFLPAAIARVAIYSKGIPRLVNMICDNALLIAFATSRSSITPDIVNEVADDLRLRDVAAHPGDGFPGLEGALRSVERSAAIAEEPRPRSHDFALAIMIFVLIAAVGSFTLWAKRGDPRARQLVGEVHSHLSSLFHREAVANVVPPAAAIDADEPPAVAPPREPAQTASVPAAAQAALPPPAAPEPLELAARPSPPVEASPNADEPEHTWTDHAVTRGTTAWEIAAAAYGPWCHLGLDLIAETNPEIADLDRILPGQRLRLPAFNARTLIRHSSGAGQVILASFASPTEAQSFASKVARRTRLEVRVRKRRPSGMIVLHRVEIIASKAATPSAWQSAASAGLLPPRFAAFQGVSKRGARHARATCAPSAVASRD